MNVSLVSGKHYIFVLCLWNYCSASFSQYNDNIKYVCKVTFCFYTTGKTELFTSSANIESDGQESSMLCNSAWINAVNFDIYCYMVTSFHNANHYTLKWKRTWCFTQKVSICYFNDLSSVSIDIAMYSIWCTNHCVLKGSLFFWFYIHRLRELCNLITLMAWG